MFPLPPFYYFEISALLVSVVVLYKFNNKPLHWFMPFLFAIICIEFTGRYIRKVLHEPNAWLYNLTIPLEYLFYGLIIGSLCLTASYKKIIFYSMALFAVWVPVNILFIQGFAFPNTHTYKIGCSLMIFFCFLGLLDLLKNDAHTTLLKNPLFWICTGVLFFNAGEFTSFFLFDRFLKNGWEIAKVFALVNNNMIYVLYTCISIAILCSNKWKKNLRETSV
ncbi:MAG TPA: hypothetical protein VK498_02280 [Ferruginibacter sp.]|nr:hypothetical protein [Ferruginibacter sp.]